MTCNGHTFEKRYTTSLLSNTSQNNRDIDYHTAEFQKYSVTLEKISYII